MALAFAEFGMNGPYPLDAATARLAPENNGVYVLVRGGGVCYVGRGNLRYRLTRHARDYRGEVFYYKSVRSEAEGFNRECELYHRYGKSVHLDNLIHPARPRGGRHLPCSMRGCNGEAY